MNNDYRSQMERKKVRGDLLIQQDKIHGILSFQLKVATLGVPPGPSSIENDAHGIEKLLLKLK